MDPAWVRSILGAYTELFESGSPVTVTRITSLGDIPSLKRRSASVPPLREFDLARAAHAVVHGALRSCKVRLRQIARLPEI